MNFADYDKFQLDCKLALYILLCCIPEDESNNMGGYTGSASPPPLLLTPKFADYECFFQVYPCRAAK